MSNSVFARLGRQGALSLEFALAALPFMLLFMGGIEMSRYVYTVQAVHSHADALLRKTLVYVGSDAQNRCLTDLAAAVTRSGLPMGLEPERLVQERRGCQRSGSVILVSVDIRYRFTFAVNLFGTGETSITRAAQQSL
ncbi:TadE/TadG family type IV pilus assembly protein [Teichococcus wenyumeiae]|nr:TadE family protein [Pseudoroseomonas wenyumeiae]